LEQYGSEQLLRPRARYMGSPPEEAAEPAAAE
jgi:hypothetical protein